MSNARNLARLLPNASGQLPDANLAAIAAGKVSGQLADANMASGSVIQVVSASLNAIVQTTSTAFVSSGLSASITPSSTTSKILILLNGSGPYNGTSGNSFFCTIYRGATNIGDVSYGFESIYSSSGAALSPHSINWLDSPATTSAITYTPYFRSNTGNVVNFSYTDRGYVALTLMEIAG